MLCCQLAFSVHILKNLCLSFLLNFRNFLKFDIINFYPKLTTDYSGNSFNDSNDRIKNKWLRDVFEILFRNLSDHYDRSHRDCQFVIASFDDIPSHSISFTCREVTIFWFIIVPLFWDRLLSKNVYSYTSIHENLFGVLRAHIVLSRWPSKSLLVIRFGMIQ
jgi:hypothetical protein